MEIKKTYNFQFRVLILTCMLLLLFYVYYSVQVHTLRVKYTQEKRAYVTAYVDKMVFSYRTGYVVSLRDLQCGNYNAEVSADSFRNMLTKHLLR